MSNIKKDYNNLSIIELAHLLFRHMTEKGSYNKAKDFNNNPALINRMRPNFDYITNDNIIISFYLKHESGDIISLPLIFKLENSQIGLYSRDPKTHKLNIYNPPIKSLYTRYENQMFLIKEALIKEIQLYET